MQEVNNMIEYSKMVIFSDVNTELEVVKEFIKTTENLKHIQEKSMESDLSIKEIFFAIEDICKVIDFISPKEVKSIKYGGRNEVERINATYNLG